MTTRRLLALVVAFALLVTVATPARAEAMEIGTVLLIAGAVVVVLILVGYLVIANLSDKRMADDDSGPAVVVIALEPRPAETQ